MSALVRGFLNMVIAMQNSNCNTVTHSAGSIQSIPPFPLQFSIHAGRPRNLGSIPSSIKGYCLLHKRPEYVGPTEPPIQRLQKDLYPGKAVGM